MNVVESDPDRSHASVVGKVCHYFEVSMNCPPPAENTKIADLGLDSVELLWCVADLCEYYRIDVTEIGDLREVVTVGDLSRKIRDGVARAPDE